MKRILLASVAALGLAGTASAADLAVKAPVVVAPVFTWSGCYLGVNGGWIGGNDSILTRPAGQLNELPPTPLSAGTIATYTRTQDSDASGGTAGGQFGCQWQWGGIVLGGEWDWAWTGLKEDYTNQYPAGTFVSGAVFPAHFQTVHKQVDWLSTARVRLGLAFDRVLVYATGGLALAAYDSYFDSYTLAGAKLFDGGYREKRIGWTIGGGLEWAFANNWTAKAEALYVDFGSFDYLSALQPAAPYASLPNDRWYTDVDASEIVVRVGINYLFHLGAPAAPVMARY